MLSNQPHTRTHTHTHTHTHRFWSQRCAQSWIDGFKCFFFASLVLCGPKFIFALSFAQAENMDAHLFEAGLRMALKYDRMFYGNESDRSRRQSAISATPMTIFPWRSSTSPLTHHALLQMLASISHHF